MDIAGKSLNFAAGKRKGMRKLSMDELNRKTVEEFKSADKTPVIIVLDNVRSMQNVGSVFRTADAFLLEGIYLCGYTATPPHRDINKTALGATETVKWEYFKKTADAIVRLRAQGYAVWGVEQAAESRKLNVFRPDRDKPMAIVFGNEVSGVEESVLKMTDGCIEIPQMGMKHSLNIAVSVGIVVWDLFNSINSLD